ncbi:hypothetical protein ACFLUO_09465 [Chloroflexota bacterium]
MAAIKYHKNKRTKVFISFVISSLLMIGGIGGVLQSTVFQEDTIHSGEGFQVSYPKDWKNISVDRSLVDDRLYVDAFLTVGSEVDSVGLVVRKDALGEYPPNKMSEYLDFMLEESLKNPDVSLFSVKSRDIKSVGSNTEARTTMLIRNDVDHTMYLKISRYIHTGSDIWEVVYVVGFPISLNQTGEQIIAQRDVQEASAAVVLNSFELTDNANNTNWFDWKWIISMLFTIVGLGLTIITAIKQRNPYPT